MTSSGGAAQVPEASDPVREVIQPPTADPAADPAGLGGVAEMLAAVAEVEIAHEELRVAQEELAAQHDQIRVLLDQVADDRTWRQRLSARLDLPVVVTDAGGVVVEANPAVARLLGVPPERLVGKPLVVFVDPPSRSAWRARPGPVEGAEVHLDVALAPRTGVPVPVGMLGIPEASPDSVPEGAGGAAGPVVRWFVSPRQTGPLVADRALAVARSLSGLARLPVEHDGDLLQLLRSVGTLVGRGLGAGAAVSVTVGPPDAPTLQAADSAFAQSADGAEFAAGEGPCLLAYSSQQVVTSASVPDDDRWPALSPLARRAGVGGRMAVPLRTATEVVGVLNVFFDGRRDELDTLVEPARLLAEAASSVIVDVRELAAMRQLSEQLRTAMESRATIEQAKGIVMARLRIGPDEAFQRLVAVSRAGNTKLRVVARLITEDPSRLDALS